MRTDRQSDFTRLLFLLGAISAEIRELRAELLASFGGRTEERAFRMKLDRLEEKARTIASAAIALRDSNA